MARLIPNTEFPHSLPRALLAGVDAEARRLLPYKPTGRKPGRPKKVPTQWGTRPLLSPRQWAALHYELARIGSLQDLDGHAWPSHASLGQVSRAVGVSREAVRKWRSDPDYRRGLNYLISDLVAATLREHNESEQSKRLRKMPRRLQMSPTNAKRDGDANLDVFLRQNWTGPTKSMLDGKVYSDPYSYLRHVKDHSGAIWVGDLPASVFVSEKEHE